VEFEALVNQHKDAVYRQMLRACGNREDAEDVLVDAMLRAWRHMDQLQDSRAFRSWLAQIGRRICWRLKDKEKLLPLMRLSALREGGHGIADLEMPADTRLNGELMKGLLLRAIEALPAKNREVYLMRDVKGISGEVAAERLGISLASMKSRLHRARGLLRKFLDNELK